MRNLSTMAGRRTRPHALARTGAALALAVLGLCQQAHATIVFSCENWKGGQELRCLAKKTDGTQAEKFYFHFANKSDRFLGVTKSEWSSTCGGAGLILSHTHSEISANSGLGAVGTLHNPNECYEVFVFSCYTKGNHVPCPDYLHATAGNLR
jgi:hypothetical protein